MNFVFTALKRLVEMVAHSRSRLGMIGAEQAGVTYHTSRMTLGRVIRGTIQKEGRAQTLAQTYSFSGMQ